MVSKGESPVFELKHLEFFCGKLPVKIYWDEKSGIHFAFVESVGTNIINASVNYVTPSFSNGISNAVAHIALRGTNGLSAARFEHYLGNIFSSKSVSIDVKSNHTSFSFDSIGGTSGYVQLLNLLLESFSTPSFSQRDFNHQIFNSIDLNGKLYEKLRKSENQLENVVNKARRERTFYGSIHGNDFIGTSRDLQLNCILEKLTGYFQFFYRDPWILLSGNLDPKLDLNLLDTLSLKYSYASKYNRNVLRAPNHSDSIQNIRFHYSDTVTVSGIHENDKGIVQIGFLGESSMNATFVEAIDVLSEYLCGSKSSRLNLELANGKTPICSSVEIQLNFGPRCEIVVQMNGVSKPYLNRGIVERFFDIIDTTKWDIEELQEIMLRKTRGYNAMIESNVHEEVFKRLNLFQLYADKNDSLLLKRLLNPTIVLNELLQLSPVYWKKFVANLFVENCVVIIGVPERNRIQNLLSNQLVGQTENSRREKKLRRSTELVKEIFKPNDLFFSQQIVDVSNALVFPFHKIFPVTLKPFHWDLVGSKLNLLPEWFKSSVKALIDPTIPLSITVHSVDSDYVKAIFLFDIRNLELRLRYYMLIFKKLLFNSSSTINGNLLFASELWRLMQNEVLEYNCEIGFKNDNFNIFSLTLKVPVGKLELIEKWFNAILCNVSFDIEDIKNAVNSLVVSARNSRKVLIGKTLLNSVTLQPEDADYFLNDIVLEGFHGELLKSLLNGNHQQIIDDLQLLRNQLLNTQISLHLIGNPKRFASTHVLNFDDLTRFRMNDNVDKILIDSKTSKNWPTKPQIHIISTKEINPISHMIELMDVECQPFDDNHAAILIFCRYFSMNGGIFWRYIEEDGQAESVKIEYNIQKQQLELTINGAKNLKPTRQLVSYLVRQMFIDSLDNDLFKVAQKSLAAKIVGPYSTVDSVGLISVYNDINGWTVDRITSFVHKILTFKESRCQVLLYDIITKLNQGKNLKSILCPAFQYNGTLKTFQDILQLTSIVQHKSDKKFELKWE